MNIKLKQLLNTLLALTTALVKGWSLVMRLMLIAMLVVGGVYLVTQHFSAKT